MEHDRNDLQSMFTRYISTLGFLFDLDTISIQDYAELNRASLPGLWIKTSAPWYHMMTGSPYRLPRGRFNSRLFGSRRITVSSFIHSLSLYADSGII
jgi:hypothetical protein